MSKLKWLIACLLVAFNCTSQTAIKDSVVVLTETISREVIKDLIRLDVCRQISKEQVSIIDLQTKKIGSYKSIIDELEYQKEQSKTLISNQNKIISRLESSYFHLYVGIRNNDFNLTSNSVFSNFMFCTKKVDTGLHATIQTDGILRYGITAQYKVF